jgi:hypothetical protein
MQALGAFLRASDYGHRGAVSRQIRRLTLGMATLAMISGFGLTAGLGTAAASEVWPSHASYTHNYNYSFSEMFNADHTGLVVADLYNNTTVYMRCYTDNQSFFANYRSNRWFLVTLTNGYTNWVPSGYVQDQASVPHC